MPAVINGKLGDLTITIVEGKNFCSKSTYCLIKLRSPSALSEKTTPSLNSSTPKWNETFTLPITIAEKEVKILVYLSRKSFCIGEIVIPIDGLKNLESTEIEKWWPIKQTSHVQLQGELFVSIKYAPLNDKNIDEEAIFNQTQVALLRSIQSGTLSTYETMERAVLDERGILDNEFKRLSKIHGSDSASASTVKTMLQSLENKSKDLRLFTLDDIDQSFLEKFEKIFDKKLETPPIVEDVAHVDSISDNINITIRNIFSLSKPKQFEVLDSLEEKLFNDLDKRSFIAGGGVQMLLKLTEEADQSLRLKTLTVLQDLTYFISNRMHKETLLVLIIDAVANLKTIENPETNLLCAAIIANASLSKDSSIQEYFNSGKGADLLVWMLDSNIESVNVRALWAISCLKPDGKSNLIRLIHDVLVAFLSSDNVDLLKWTTSVLSNLTFCEQNHQYFNFALIYPLLIKLLSNSDTRVVFESLRSLTNICVNQSVRNSFARTEDLNLLLQLLLSKDNDIQMQAAWVIANLAIDEKTISLLNSHSALEKILDLLNNGNNSNDSSEESKRKALWVLQNLLTDDNCKESFISHNGAEVMMKLLSSNSGELVVMEVLKLLMYLSNIPSLFEAFHTLKIHEVLAHLLLKKFSDPVKEQICWIVAKIANDRYQDLFREVGIIGNLVEVVEEGVGAKKAAIWALFNLSVGNEENLNILKKIAIEPLVKCLQDKSLRDIAAKVLSILATGEAEKLQIVDFVSRSVKTLKISYSK